MSTAECRKDSLSRILRALVPRLVGCLLLTAAILKFYGPGFETVSTAGIFSDPAFQVAVVEFEIFLGLWLLSGKVPVGSWLTAIAVFAGFSAVSFYQGWIGQSSCGCFGNLSVSPWWAFGIDLGIIAVLLVARPDLSTLWANPRSVLSRLAAGVGSALAGLALILALLAGIATLSFGSTDAALAYLRGDRISLGPRLVDVGTGTPGELRQTTLELINRTDHSIRLIGGTSD